jgi:hypothetical protein
MTENSVKYVDPFDGSTLTVGIMTENSAKYVDVIDGSTLTVKPVGHADFEGYLRFEAEEAGADELPAAVDLTRADVQNLIQYALEWLEDTKPKPPTTPGSVVRIPRHPSVQDIILTRLNENGRAALGVHGPSALWVSQYGTFWTDGELVGEAGDRFEVIHDAGKTE